MNHAWWILVLNALAVFRLTRLLVSDTITSRLRDGELKVGGFVFSLYPLLSCPWCVSVYFGAGVVALSDWQPHYWPYVAAALSFSAVSGLIAERS